MNADPKVSDVDDAPEFSLSSPTDSLSRDHPPLEDDAGVEQVSSEDVKRGDVEANPDDLDVAGDDGSDESN